MEYGGKKMNIDKDTVVRGVFSFQTCKTGRGKTRYLAKVTGKIGDDVVSCQYFGDWDGQFPANMAVVNAHGFRDPETGLIRSVTGSLDGEVTVPAGAVVIEKPGTVAGVTLRQIDLTDPDGFIVKETNRKFTACTL